MVGVEPQHYKDFSGQLHTLATLPAGEKHLAPTENEAGWAPEQRRTFWRTGKSLAPAGYLIPVHSAQILVSLPLPIPAPTEYN